LEDYVHAPNGLTNVFTKAGLMKYWFPLASMPRQGQDWPLVSDMIAKNQRLLVFTSIKSKEKSEGIAYQWNFMVENQCKKIPTIKPISFLGLCFCSSCQLSFWSCSWLELCRWRWWYESRKLPKQGRIISS